MPFTFSHPAAVLFLPQITRRLSLTALVIGSIMPDMEYFLRMRTYSTLSHSALGVLLFNLPLGLLATFIFHYLIRDSLLQHLPLSLRWRLHPLAPISWRLYVYRHWPWVLCSLLLGIVSHLLWDSLTHAGSDWVVRWHFLRQPLLGSPVYRILQHTSSLLGALIIAYYVLRLPKIICPLTLTTPYYWPLVFTCTCLVLGLRWPYLAPSYAPVQVLVSAITAGLLALMVVPLLLTALPLKTLLPHPHR